MSSDKPKPPPRLKVRAWVRSELVKLPNAPTRHQLRGKSWTKIHHGVVVWADQDLTSPFLRVMAAAEALRDAPVAGWAAALLHGAQDLDGGRGVGKLEPIPFYAGPDRSKRPRAGLMAMRSRISEDDVQKVGRIACTTPVRTAFDLARTAPSIHQAVADVDCLLRAQPKVLTTEEFAAYVARQKGFTGVGQARAAVPLISPLARSRPESVLRVVWTADAGLPTPLVNPKVTHRVSGRTLGLPDLLDEDSGLVGEYDGAHHRDLHNHSDDNVREEAFEDAGLTVVRVTAVDFRRRSGLVARLLRGHRRALRQTVRDWVVDS